ncbi:hypothetical protein [Archangium sp.]|uniref:hypothetical protein n=1 Tax=Archangium sp. TaxID=1872627 RepID=UPI00389A14E7
MMLPRFPDGWQVRQGARTGVTIIHGWDSRQGLVVTLVVAGVLVPLLLAASVWAALVAFLTCLVVGMGLGYRLVIAPEGLIYQRTWYGVRWRRRPLSLKTPVVEWSTFEEPESEALVLESKPPITLPAPRAGVETLRQALQEAIQRAAASTPAEPRG